MDSNQQLREVEESIKGVLISQLGVEAGTVAASDSDTPLLGRGIGLDSVEALALILGIEEEFDIEIPDEALTANLFRSVATLADYVWHRLVPRTAI
jgi:acyl carrier protein